MAHTDRLRSCVWLSECERKTMQSHVPSLLYQDQIHTNTHTHDNCICRNFSSVCIICSILLFAIQFTIPFGWLFPFVSSIYVLLNKYPICHANSAKDYYVLFLRFFFGTLRLTDGNNFAMIVHFIRIDWPKPWPMSKHAMSTSNSKTQKW